jgi:hypothetical protein
MKINRFVANCVAHLNGEKLEIRGNGTRANGIIEGLYKSSLFQPFGDIARINHQIFNCLLVTGYPSETEAREGSINPFAEVPYSYDRTVTFSDGNVVQLHTEVWFEGSELQSTFDVNGAVNLPELVSVDPTVETWAPLGDNRVMGTFLMTWTSLGGEKISARADTIYRIPSGIKGLKENQFRWIDIVAEGNLSEFTRYQKSILFTRLDLAKH